MKNQSEQNRTNYSDIYLFVMYGYNYEYDFIEKVWAGSLAEHLKSKFLMYYDRYGPNGVFNAFYVNLDSGNQAKIENYILTNFKG